MKKLTLAIVFFGFVAGPSGRAAAQDGGGRQPISLGVDGQLALPIGDFGDGAGIGIGALLNFGYPLNEQVTLTGRVGYVHHLEKNNLTFSEIPFWVGAAYGLSPPLSLVGELGFVNGKVSAGGQSASDTNLALGLGVLYGMGTIDLGARLQMLNLDHAGDSMQIAVTAGYKFTSF